MMNFLYEILGEYTFETFSFVLLFWQCSLCIFLFMLKHKRRRLFVLRYIGCFTVGTAICYGIAVLNTDATDIIKIPVRIFCYNAVTAINFATLLICYRHNMTELLLCWCSGLAVYQFTNKLYPFIQNMVGIDDRTTISLINGPYTVEWYDWLIFLTFHIACYLLLAFIFRRDEFLSKDKVTSRGIVTTAVITTLFMHGLICVARLYEAESFALNVIIKIFSMAFGMAILIICAAMYTGNRSRQEMNVMRRLWKQEQSQFDSIKANIDFINAKCHDLKHLFNKLEGKLNDADLEKLKDAVQFYDNSIRTGNEILDVVLCEKLTVCASRNIRLTCMADGSNMNFLTAAQIYSLFGNIIDNAIEAVSAIEEQDKRIIALTVKNKNGKIEIDVSNFFKGERVMTNGLPQTVKDDPSRHGYGLKSIGYIVKQKGGDMKISMQNERFSLCIAIPVPENSEKVTPPHRTINLDSRFDQLYLFVFQSMSRHYSGV